MKPQNAQTLALLRSRGEYGVTPLEAFAAIGTMRLGARIHELIHVHGFLIDSELVTTTTGKRVSRYTIREKPVQLTTFDSLSRSALSPLDAPAQVAERSPLAGSRPG